VISSKNFLISATVLLAGFAVLTLTSLSELSLLAQLVHAWAVGG